MPSHGNALVTKYLNADQRASLASEIASNLHTCTQDVAILADLLPLLDPSCLDDLYPQLLSFVIETSGNDTGESIGARVLLVAEYPGLRLRNAVLSHALSVFKLHMNPFDFLPGVQKWVAAERCPNESCDIKELYSLLRLLSAVFTEIACDSSELDKGLALFLAHNDSELSSACSKVLRWRTESIKSQMLQSDELSQFYWDLIFELTKEESPKEAMLHGFVMWLRLLSFNTPEEFKSNAHFQEHVINQNNYWLVLQRNLAGNSHEARKFCLSILQLSLKSIGCSFSTEILSWNQAQENQLVRQWSRFTTLFEVLGIDTSLHQTQAAYHDILAIITPDSLVQASWGFCLLATGFQASIDSVRRYCVHILFSIKKENLHLLKYGLQYLEDYFLPYMMVSRHFAVRTDGGVAKVSHCKYAESFSSFIASLFSNLKTPQEILQVSSSLLRVLVDRRETFDAVRIYATMGMIKGLSGKNVLTYGVHDILLLKLFDNFSEGDLFWKVVQTLNLRLLLSFELDSLSQFDELMTKFNSFNGYEIFNENLSLITEYLQENAVCARDLYDHADNVQSVDSKVALLRLASHMSGKTCFPEKCSTLLISKLVESGAPFPMSSILSDLVLAVASQDESEDESEDVYLALGNTRAQLPIQDDLSLQNLWDRIVAENMSGDYGVLRKVVAKFRFFNKLIDDSGFHDLEIGLESILELSQKLFCNSAGCARNVTSFYKLKDSMMAELHKLMSLFVSQFPNLCDLNSLIPAISFGTTHPKTLSSICDIMMSLMDNKQYHEGLNVAMIGIIDSVGELDADRFKLSDRKLHLKLINMMLHEEMLQTAVHDELIGSIILAFCQTIIFNSYGRRGLMPALMKALSDFQVKNPDQFEKLSFLPEFFVKAMGQNELQSSAYKIEALVGKVYDSYLAPVADSDIFAEVYGVEEVSYKVWLLASINSIQSSTCSERILEYLFSEENEFFSIKRATNGVEEFFRVQIAKIMLSLIDNVDAKVAIKLYLDEFIELVETDPSPLVRVYFEWAIAKLLLAQPQFTSKIYDKLENSIQDHEMKPILVIAYERIIFLVIQSMDRENAEIYLTKFITYLVAVASTNKALTRHFSMSLALSVHEEISKKHLQIDEGLKEVIANMHKSALSTEAYGQFRSGDAYLWNITGDYNLVNISGGILLRLYDREVEFLTERDFKFLTSEQLEILRRPIGTDQMNLWVSKLKESPSSQLQESSSGVVSPLQTKSGGWSAIMDVDEKARSSDIKRSDLIVVASLVDKLPNLGGICRLCDVLGAGLLTLHDLKVKQSQQFKSVAVTADYWMPMAEVRPEALVAYLRAKKKDGYTLIGLEQTDKSVVLDEKLRFPPKSLLLLGREKEGVPGELLAELDFCVEIKQVGVVRSMNIQTATAVVVHAYSSQNC